MKFVVLTTQRSGSTWVMSVLRGFPGVSAHGELFLPQRRSGEGWDPSTSYQRFVELPRKSPRPFSAVSYLNTLYAGPGTVGFKLMYSQARRYPEVALYLVQRRISVVHLVRRNLLDVVISGAMLVRLGRGHLKAGETSPEALKVRLDIDQLVPRLRGESRKRVAARRFLSLARLRHVEVAYEDLVSDEAGFEHLWRFLGGTEDWNMPPTEMARIRRGTQKDAVSNYDEVRAALTGTEFITLLDS